MVGHGDQWGARRRDGGHSVRDGSGRYASYSYDAKWKNPWTCSTCQFVHLGTHSLCNWCAKPKGQKPWQAWDAGKQAPKSEQHSPTWAAILGGSPAKLDEKAQTAYEVHLKKLQAGMPKEPLGEGEGMEADDPELPTASRRQC